MSTCRSAGLQLDRLRQEAKAGDAIADGDPERLATRWRSLSISAEKARVPRSSSAAEQDVAAKDGSLVKPTST